MKITLAQPRLRVANFEYNYESIIKCIKEASLNSDLIIFPQVTLSEIGGKDMASDEVCADAQDEMFIKLSNQNFKQALLIGNLMIKDGEIYQSVGGFFEFGGKKIYVDSEFKEDIEADLYVLAKNSYFTMNDNLIDNIECASDFVYVNAVTLSDEKVFYGSSFAKNQNGELVLRFPMCEEAVEEIDFTKRIEDDKTCMEEKIYKVLTYALREYCDSIGFKKVVLGLSGGIDSALTAALAVNALGSENVLGIQLPSMYSSEGSLTDSLKLAENLNVKLEKHPITPLFNTFIEDFESRHDLAEENLQARIRAMILMFISNREGHLLLSTGNKSEVAMGYGTLYGDMAGGLNLIADLTKTNVYKLSNWINRNGIVIPQEIIDKAPSAELRPGQKDQDSLPEYAVLDDIIEMYVEENAPIEDIYEKYGKELTDSTIKKLYCAEFKRRQGCLGIRLTERAFCSNVQLPILQGMY